MIRTTSRLHRAMHSIYIERTKLRMRSVVGSLQGCVLYSMAMLMNQENPA